MFDLNTVPHHPAIEEITNLICSKTQNTDKNFFRIVLAYFFAKVASCMRATVTTKDRGDIPINVYAVCLAQSGYGKGHSVNIIESELLEGFKKVFIQSTMPLIAAANIDKIAIARAVAKHSSEQTEIDKYKAAYQRAGAYPFTFDSGTTPAIKQLRNKLLLAKCGSINFQCDEIGTNLLQSTEVLATFLELYDQGMVKQKLIKNTADNIRDEDLDGKTPANMLLFGTPSKLFDGSSIEDCFYSLLDTGYARRCLFGFGQKAQNKAYYSKTPKQIYDSLTASSNVTTIRTWQTKFTSLANPANYNKKITLNDNEAILLLTYKIECEKIADQLSEFDDIKKAELSHRYFKALKVAGAFAFIDGVSAITETHLKQAIKLVELSGECFNIILHRDAPYMKLAKYIANSNDELTNADLSEALPFYKTSLSLRKEIMNDAIAWGYKNSILIKKTYTDNIEFFKGETLEKTDLDKLILSSSNHVAYNYKPSTVKFKDLASLGSTSNYHWCNHWFKDEHRTEGTAEDKFNLVVIDVDNGIKIDTARDLLKDYTYFMYTTKRHTSEENRFRIILPIAYTLKLDSQDYKEFMNNIMKWLPFKSDEAANQRSKKWETNKGTCYSNDTGTLVDPLKFIPRTSRNEQYKKSYSKVENLDNLERWFVDKIEEGNRNNTMIKYALALVDSGLSYQNVESKVKSFNSQLPNPLSEQELNGSIFVTVAKRYATTGDD